MRKNVLTSGVFLKPFIGVWCAWIMLHASFIYWLHYSLLISISDSLLFNLPLIALCVFQVFIMQFYLPKQNKLAYIAVSGLIISLTVTFLSGLLIRIIFQDNTQYISFVNKSFPVRLGMAFLLSTVVNMMNILIYSLEEQKKYEKRRFEAERLSRESELMNLRSQLQPHFLFNSLNSISALAGSRPEEARKMIQQLSDFFRGTIRKDERNFVSIREELNHLQLYLEIEKVRFGHRLEAVVSCEEACNEMKIPSLLLQPLIENAIKFGLYDTTGKVLISIMVNKEDNDLVVRIENPFDPESSAPKTGTGFGLKAVQRRLFLLFSRNDLLTTSATNNLFTTTIKIPQLK